jgi:hypothetical protein
VPWPPRVNLVTGKWVFKHKFRPDGSFDKYKARWVVCGFTQRVGVDFGKTFAPVIKLGTIHTVLTLAASKQWPVHQLDVSNAFLHGHLQEQVYYHQPTRFIDIAKPAVVYSLLKSLYGLKQAPRAWFTRFAQYAKSIGFNPTRSDSSLFIFKDGSQLAYLLLYVNDMILTTSSTSLLGVIISRLQSEFAVKDMGTLWFFLVVGIRRSSTDFFLSQDKYVEDLLERAGMVNSKVALTPVDMAGKLPIDADPPVADPSEYHSFTGGLQYLTITRPDIVYAIQQVCLHMHDLRASHLALLKRVLRYVRGTTSFGLHLRASSSTAITTYTDADWA